MMYNTAFQHTKLTVKASIVDKFGHRPKVKALTAQSDQGRPLIETLYTILYDIVFQHTKLTVNTSISGKRGHLLTVEALITLRTRSLIRILTLH